MIKISTGDNKKNIIEIKSPDSNNIVNTSNNMSKYYSDLALKYAVGIPTEPQEGSAKYWATVGSAKQQSDWEQNDNTKSDYICNKPVIPTKISDLVNDSGFTTRTYHDSTKQDTLVSGTNIKTINSNSILGSGNVVLDGLPSQSGQSGKYLTTDGIAASWAEVQSGSTYHPNIFDTKWSDHLINDIQWLRGDTFSWQDGSVYVTAYNKLVEEYNASTSTEETEGDITFKRSANGFKIATSDYESAILNKYNTDGISWYYILDTTNQRFKLPRTKFGFEGLRTNVADDIAESLPNITGNIYHLANENTQGEMSGDGAFSITNTGGDGCDGSAGNFYNASFNASNSSSTYQDNAPVQERATQMYLYFYVGEYSQTAIEQTAGLNSEMFNSKVDTSSLSEINPMIESYVNGTSGYNIWSNGYCEQWGEINNIDGIYTITLFKTFANTDFCSMKTLNWNESTEGISRCYFGCWNKTTTTMQTYSYTSPSTNTENWRACGYLAEGEY